MIIKITIDGNSNSYNLNNLNKEIISFGRSSECDINVNAPSVSKVHGCFYRENNEWYIKDLDSRFGTFRSGTQITDEKIDFSDKYSVGAPGSGDAMLEFFSDDVLKKTDVLTGESSLAIISGNVGTDNIYDKKKPSGDTLVTHVLDSEESDDVEISAKILIGIFIVVAIIVAIILVILI